MSKQTTKHSNLLNLSLKKGDTRAYQTIFDQHYNRLFSYINTYTKNESNTKDILQETFIKLWNNRENIDENASILAYLHKIAYNIFIDNYRKGKRQKNMLDSLAYETVTNSVEDDDNEITTRKIEIIKKSINELPPRCQEVFRLSKYEGLKYTEIAETLNISIKTVEAQMGKAFSYIRKQVNNINNSF